MLQSTLFSYGSSNPPPLLPAPTHPTNFPPSLLSFSYFFATPTFHKHNLNQQWQAKEPKKNGNFLALAATYEVGGGYPDDELDAQGRRGVAQEQENPKLDTSQYEALLKGGEQVISVLQELITLVSSFPSLFTCLCLLGC